MQDKDKKTNAMAQIIQATSEVDSTDIKVSDNYVRKNYVDQKKMTTTKNEAYTNSDGSIAKTMRDPYKKDMQLHRSQRAADNKYGQAKKTEHTSQTDHTVPLENIYNKHKSSAWLTDEDIKRAANNKHNLKEISTHINEQKRMDTNIEYVYKHWDELAPDERIKMVGAHVEGSLSTEVILTGAKAKNMARTASDGAGAALVGATPALVHQGAKDLIKVTKGEMTIGDAAKDVIKNTGTVATTGAATSIIKHEVEHVANKISEKVGTQLLDSNTVGQVVGIAISLKDCTKRFVDGDIDAGEYLIQVLEDGTGFVISSLAYSAGNMIGGPLAGACCSYVISTAYEELIGTMRDCRASKKHLGEMECAAKQIREEIERYKLEYITAFDNLYENRAELIIESFNSIISGLRENDANFFINGINIIASAYGINYRFDSFEEIDAQMQDPNYVFVF